MIFVANSTSTEVRIIFNLGCLNWAYKTRASARLTLAFQTTGAHSDKTRVGGDLRTALLETIMGIPPRIRRRQGRSRRCCYCSPRAVVMTAAPFLWCVVVVVFGASMAQANVPETTTQTLHHRHHHRWTESAAAATDNEELDYLATTLDSGRLSFATFRLGGIPSLECSGGNSTNQNGMVTVSSSSSSSSSTVERVRSATEDCLRQAVAKVCAVVVGVGDRSAAAFGHVDYVGLGNAQCITTTTATTASNDGSSSSSSTSAAAAAVAVAVEIRGGVMDFTGTPAGTPPPKEAQILLCISAALASDVCIGIFDTYSLDASKLIFSTAATTTTTTAMGQSASEGGGGGGDDMSSESTSDETTAVVTDSSNSTGQSNKSLLFPVSAAAAAAIAGGVIVFGLVAAAILWTASHRQPRSGHQQRAKTVHDDVQLMSTFASLPDDDDDDDECSHIIHVGVDTNHDKVTNNTDNPEDSFGDVDVELGSCAAGSPSEPTHGILPADTVTQAHVVALDCTLHSEQEEPPSGTSCSSSRSSNTAIADELPLDNEQDDADDGYVSSSSSSCSGHNGRRDHGQVMRHPFQFNAQQGPPLNLIGDGIMHAVASDHREQPIHVQAAAVTNPVQNGDTEQAPTTRRHCDSPLHHPVATPSNKDNRFVSDNDNVDQHDSPYHSASDFEPDLDWDPDDNSVSSADPAATATDAINDSCDFSIVSTSTKSMPLSWRDMLSSSSLSPESPTIQRLAPRRRSNEAIVNADKDDTSNVGYYHRRSHTTSSSNPPRSILEWRRTTPTSPPYTLLEPMSPATLARPAAITKSRSLPSLLLLDHRFEGPFENSADLGQDVSNQVIAGSHITKTSMSYSRRRRSTSTTPRKIYLLHNT
jgi:hypothetical protein